MGTQSRTKDLTQQETEEDKAKPIETLVGNGITESDISKLKAVGIATVEAVAYTARKNLISIKGLSEAKVDKLQSLACGKTEMGFTTASFVLSRRNDMIKLTTGSKELDKLLGGGIETSSITEIVGEAGSGKSQICHSLAVTAQLNIDEGGGQGKVIYLHTEQNFRPERLIDGAERYGKYWKDVTDNVMVPKAYNTDYQMKMLDTAAAIMVSQRFSLLIVDSAMSLYRTDYIGRGELQSRQSHLGQFLKRLRRLADEFGVAVVITNVVLADVGGSQFFKEDPKKAAGGHIMSHGTITRLTIRKGPKGTRIAKLTGSPHLPEKEASFVIKGDGIRDVDE